MCTPRAGTDSSSPRWLRRRQRQAVRLGGVAPSVVEPGEVASGRDRHFGRRPIGTLGEDKTMKTQT